MLNIEDLKVGDKVEAIRDFIGNLVVGSMHTISYVNATHFKIDGDEDLWDKRYLSELFKKKEQSQYTFDDLIRAARKAFDDGIINHVKTSKSVVFELEITTSEGSERRWHHGDLSYIDGINYIKSLYKETFVIKDMKDIVNINKDAVTTLQNGCIFNGNEFKELQVEPKRLLEILNGATVEQSK